MLRNTSLFEKLDKRLIEIYKEMKIDPNKCAIVLALDEGKKAVISRKYDNWVLSDALKDIANRLIPKGIYIDNVLNAKDLRTGFGSSARNSLQHFELSLRATANSLEKKQMTARELALEADGFDADPILSDSSNMNPSPSETVLPVPQEKLNSNVISDNKDDASIKKINFHILTMLGKTIIVECSPCEKISVIKQCIFEQANIPIEHQVILLDGKILKNDLSLSDYNYLTVGRAHLAIRSQEPSKSLTSSLGAFIETAGSSSPIFSTQSSSFSTNSASDNIRASLSPTKISN